MKYSVRNLELFYQNSRLLYIAFFKIKISGGYHKDGNIGKFRSYYMLEITSFITSMVRLPLATKQVCSHTTICIIHLTCSGNQIK